MNRSRRRIGDKVSESLTDPINIYLASPMYKTLDTGYTVINKLSCLLFLWRLYSSGRVSQPINRQISQPPYFSGLKEDS